MSCGSIWCTMRHFWPTLLAREDEWQHLANGGGGAIDFKLVACDQQSNRLLQPTASEHRSTRLYTMQSHQTSCSGQAGVR